MYNELKRVTLTYNVQRTDMSYVDMIAVVNISRISVIICKNFNQFAPVTVFLLSKFFFKLFNFYSNILLGIITRVLRNAIFIVVFTNQHIPITTKPLIHYTDKYMKIEFSSVIGWKIVTNISHSVMFSHTV